LKHTASKRFWQCLDALPADVQALAHRIWIGAHGEYDKLVG
jgi:hypothetical protein